MAVVVFAEPDLFAFEQHRFVVVLVHFGQCEQPSLFVDVGQAVAAADEALAAGHAPACTQPAGAVLVGVVAAAPYQRQDAFEGEVGFVLQKLQPVYRVDRPADRRRRFAGDARFGRQPLLELAVHVEQVAGTDDVAFADFDAGGMAHRPGRFGGGSAQHAFAAGQRRLVAGGAVGFAGFEYERRLAVDFDVFGHLLGAAEVGKQRKRDRRYLRKLNC